MKPSVLFITVSLATLSFAARAEIYKHVDADGHVTYSSTPLKGAKKLELEPLPTMSPPTKPQTSPASGFPRVDPATQSRRDDTRRKILEDELATEQLALEEARRKLQEAQDTPQVFRGPDGKTYRNVAKYEEEIKAAQDEVSAHEKNIDALKSELIHLSK